jgi:hypothetical protein
LKKLSRPADEDEGG